MATYAIGDIQGCYDQLQNLLIKLKFKSDKDTLWFAGDIINRGPDSLKTLRFIKSLEDNAITILGNHDLNLLAIAHGHAKPAKKDTIDDILNAKDADHLLEWLLHRPLVHYQKKHNICMVHAGIHPDWSLKQTLKYAAEVEQILQGPQAETFFKHMYGNKPDKWNNKLTGWNRLRFITNCFTRLRYINEDLKFCLNEKGAPGSQAKNIHPWFEFSRKEDDLNIVFGHWSTLKDPKIKHFYPLDTGCLWGGKLTALKINKHLDNRTAVKCVASQTIS